MTVHVLTQAVVLEAPNLQKYKKTALQDLFVKVMILSVFVNAMMRVFQTFVDAKMKSFKSVQHFADIQKKKVTSNTLLLKRNVIQLMTHV